MDRDEQLGEAVEIYLALAEEGSPPDPDEFASRYPDLGEDLVAALEGLALIRGLVGEPNGPGNRLESGRRIAGYRIVRELGRGGMGTVYEAVHVGLDRPVALKVLGTHATPDSNGRRRFLNEARTAAGLHHTHIVPVFDVGQVGALCYYAMQRIEGCGLDQVLRHLRRDRTVAAGSSTGGSHTSSKSKPKPQAPSPPSAAPSLAAEDDTATWLGQSGHSRLGSSTPLSGERKRDEEPTYIPPVGSAYYRWVAKVGREAAEALAHAHRRGVIHRDIKPSNLLADDRGMVWVADFGLARRLADPGLTHHDSLLGTPRYMSPEQARIGPIDGRTDVYSLGATLYELLTLRPPFEGQSAAELVEQIRDREPVSPRQFDHRIPRDLETIILKALAKRPTDRYASAQDLAEDLERFLNHEPVLARRITPVGRAWRYARRHPGGTLITTVATTIVLAVATTAYIRIVQDRDQARADRQRAEVANQKSRAEMRERYLSEATVVRHSTRLDNRSNRPNRRARGLSLLQSAAQLEPSNELKTKLRNEAVEFLIMRDVEARPEFPSGVARAIAFGPNGTRFAALTDNGLGGEAAFSLWSVANRKLIQRHLLANDAQNPNASSGAGSSNGAGSGPGSGTGTGTTTTAPASSTRSSSSNSNQPPRWNPWHVPSLAMSGETVIAVPPGGRGLLLFDRETGAQLPTLIAPDRRILSITAAPSGNRLVTIEVPTQSERGPREMGGGGPKMGEFQVRLYDPASFEQPIAVLARWRPSGGQRDEPLIAFSPDGETVATARRRDSIISLWSAETGESLGEPIDSLTEVTSMALGPDGLLAAAGGGVIRFWEIDSRTPLPSLAPYQSYIRHLRFNPKGTLLAAAGAPGSGVEIWDPASHASLAVLPVQNMVEDLAFSSDGNTLAAASSTASISVWAVVDPIARTQLSGFDAIPNSLAFAADSRLAMGSTRGKIRIWSPNQCPTTTRNAKTRSLADALLDSARDDRPVALLFDTNDDLVAIDPETIPIRSRWGRRPRMAFFMPPPVTTADQGESLFVARGREIFHWNGPQKPQQWDVQRVPSTRGRKTDSNGNGEPNWSDPDITQMVVSPKQDRLYLLTADLTIRAIVLPSEQDRTRHVGWQLPGKASHLALSPDGQILAVGDRSGNVTLIDAEKGTIRSRLRSPSSEPEGQQVFSLAFSPSGRELAVGLQQGDVELWSLTDRSAPLLRLPSHRGFVTALKFDPKGRYLASAGSDRVVDVWDLDRLQQELAKIALAW